MAITLSSSLAKQIQDALARTPIPTLGEFINLSYTDPDMREAGYANFGQPGWPNQTYQNYLRDSGLTQEGIVRSVLYQNAASAGWEQPDYWSNSALGDVWKAPNGHYYISPYSSGSWPGTFDPNTGFIDLGTNGYAVMQQGVANRNAAYTGGDWVSDMLGAVGPALMMGGVGALAFAPAAIAEAAAAAPLAEAAVAPIAETVASTLPESYWSMTAEAANAGLPSAAAGTIAPAATTPAASALDAALSAAGDVMLPEGVVAPQGGILQQLVDAGVPAQIVQTLPAAIEKTAINVGLNVLQGKDVNLSNIGSSLLTGTAGVVLGNEVGNSILNETGSSILASTGSGATQGALGALVSGADPIQTALASATASTIGSIAKDYGINIPQASINNTVGAIANGASLGQALASGAIAAGTGLAKDAISGTMTAYNADQQTAGLQAASDLGNAPTQGFDNNGNPIYRDSSGVWTNGQGVQVDPATGEPTQTIDTSSVEVTPYKQADAVIGTELPIYQNTALPSDQVTGALPSAQQVMSEILVEDQKPATTPLPPIPAGEWISGYDLPSGDTQTSPAPTPATVPVTTTVPVATTVSGLPSTSGTPSGSSGSSQKTSDVSQYVNPIPAYLQPTLLSTGQPSQVSSLWAGLDPKLANILTQRFAHGGSIHPQLMKVLQERGGDLVPGPENRLYMRHAKRGFAVEGPGTGQSDDIPTMLADSEYVIDADTVAALGDGSSKAGAEVLDKMRMAIRKHKRSAPIDKIPPKAKSPLEYIKEGMKMNHKKK